MGVPSLLFIRKVSTSDAVSQNWELNGQIVYKCVNGEQGSVAMPYLLTKDDEPKNDEFWLQSGKQKLQQAGKVFGSEHSSLILETIRAFYNHPGKFKEMNNAVANKIKVDAAGLLREVISDHRHNLVKKRKGAEVPLEPLE